MINIGVDRNKYILNIKTIPNIQTLLMDCESISYQVTVSGELDGVISIPAVVVYAGSSRYFGGDYEIDVSDWIDTFLTKYTYADVNGGGYYDHCVTSCTVVIDLEFHKTSGASSSSSMTYVWEPDPFGIAYPVDTTTCGGAKLLLYNTGWAHYDEPDKELCIPLWVNGYILKGKTIDKFVKTNYMDKYGDYHNGSVENRFEIECYMDPDWLDVHKDVYDYGVVMAAMQASKRTYLKGVNFLTIKGMGSSGSVSLEGRVKDVESVEVYSSYNSDRRVPSLKITFEVYR